MDRRTLMCILLTAFTASAGARSVASDGPHEWVSVGTCDGGDWLTQSDIQNLLKRRGVVSKLQGHRVFEILVPIESRDTAVSLIEGHRSLYATRFDENSRLLGGDMQELYGVDSLVEAWNSAVRSRRLVRSRGAELLLRVPVLADLAWDEAVRSPAGRHPAVAAVLEQARADIGHERTRRLAWIRVLPHPYTAPVAGLLGGFDVSLQTGGADGGTGSWEGQTFEVDGQWTARASLVTR